MKILIIVSAALLVLMILVKAHISTMDTAVQWYSCELSSDGQLFLATDKGIDLYNKDMKLWKHISIPNQRADYRILLENETLYMIGRSNEYIVDLDASQIISISPIHSYSAIDKERFQLKQRGIYSAQLKATLGNFWIEYEDETQNKEILKMDIKAYIWKVVSFIVTCLLFISGAITLIYGYKNEQYRYRSLAS